MAKVHNEEFKREAVRIALTSGQPRTAITTSTLHRIGSTGTSMPINRTRNGQAISPISGLLRAGCIWR
jgi:hypothetical protein